MLAMCMNLWVLDIFWILRVHQMLEIEEDVLMFEMCMDAWVWPFCWSFRILRNAWSVCGSSSFLMCEFVKVSRVWSYTFRLREGYRYEFYLHAAIVWFFSLSVPFLFITHLPPSALSVCLQKYVCRFHALLFSWSKGNGQLSHREHDSSVHFEF